MAPCGEGSTWVHVETRAFLETSTPRELPLPATHHHAIRATSPCGRSTRACRGARRPARGDGLDARDRVPKVSHRGGQGRLSFRFEHTLHERAFVSRAGPLRNEDHARGRPRVGVLRRLGEELRRVRRVQRARGVPPRRRPGSRALRGQDLQGLPRLRALQKGRGVHAVRARHVRGERCGVLTRRGVPAPRAVSSTIALFVRAAGRKRAGLDCRTELSSGRRPGLSRGVQRRRRMQAHERRMPRRQRRGVQSLQALSARRPMLSRSRDGHVRRSCGLGLRGGGRVPSWNRSPPRLRAPRRRRRVRRPRALVQARRHVPLSR
jgi:hypothetical protein